MKGERSFPNTAEPHLNEYLLTYVEVIVTHFLNKGPNLLK